MASDHYSAIGAEYRKESLRLFTRVLFFALLLVLVHLLEIKPSEIDAGGLKVAIKDPVVVRGGISLIFLYYFWNLVEATFQGSAMLPIRTDKRTLRYLVSVAQRPYKNQDTKKMTRRDPKQAKRHAWWWMTLYMLFMMPFALTIFGLLIMSLCFGFSDAWSFVAFAWNRSIELGIN